MRLFVTSYREGKYLFASYVYAETRKDAKKLLKRRGLGEFIQGEKDCSVVEDPTYYCSALNYYNAKMFNECVHWLCFAGNVLCNAKLWKRKDLLSDYGLIHMVSHQAMRIDPNFKFKDHQYLIQEDQDLREQLKKFDRLTKKLGY